MAVQYEDLGNGLTRAYSDTGVKIRGGFPEGDYDEAVDPTSLQRKYTETDIHVIDENEEAQIEDYIEALKDLGVNINV